MNKAKYYVLVFASKQDRADGNQEYEFDCTTLAEAEESASEEVTKNGMYAASIYERSGTTAPSARIATHIIPLAAVTA